MGPPPLPQSFAASPASERKREARRRSRWRSWLAGQWERSTSAELRLQAQLAALWETAEDKLDHPKWMKAFGIKGRIHILHFYMHKMKKSSF